MDASCRSCSRNASHVEDQVPDLTEEGVRSSPSQLAVGLILVAVNEAETDEAGGSFEHR